MTVSAVSSTSTSTTGTAASQKSTLSSDFDTFLRMLSVQMQNQDPLNPIDSTDYAVQLATFSGVEQQVLTNQLLTDMQSRLQQMGLAEMAGWIGKEARTDAAVHFDGSPVTLSSNPTVGATGLVISVRDAQGNLVSREELPASAAPYQWLGADISGNPLPNGIYTITQESLIDEEVVDSRAVEHYARVVEARGTGTGTSLVLAGGVEVASGDVTALREAS